MRNMLRLIAVLAPLCCISTFANAQLGEVIPGQYIAIVESGADAEEIARDLDVVPDEVYTTALQGFAFRSDTPRLRSIEADSRVISIEPDRLVGVDSTFGASARGASSWGLDRIDQRRLPLDGVFHTFWTGSGVTAYVFDTGIKYDHSEFEGRAIFGFDGFGGDGSDCVGHGTHVAGTIGGRTVGVARKTKLVSVRVLGCGGTGANSIFLKGIEWVARNHVKPSVVNMSMVGKASEATDLAVKNLIAKGIPVFAAAGNGNADACRLSPGRVPGVVAVGSTDAEDKRASTSNHGNCLSTFAPGRKIVSAGTKDNTELKEMSGTSMAAPHAAGAAALILENAPMLASAALKDLLLQNVSHSVVLDARSGVDHLLQSN